MSKIVLGNEQTIYLGEASDADWEHLYKWIENKAKNVNYKFSENPWMSQKTKEEREIIRDLINAQRRSWDMGT